MKKLLIIALLFVFAFGVWAIFYIDYRITSKTAPYIQSDVNKIAANKVGLLLGTSKYLSNGKLNPFFQNRIKAAVMLYKAQKIKYLILSGDNRLNSYNEPRMMKKELMKMGIPDSVIYFDFAGFRTFDSVIRCRFIFSQTSFTIISQDFHLERAVFIAHYYGINAVGFGADDVAFHSGLTTRIREYFARVKLVWDIYSGYEPRFLGEKIEVR